MNIQFFTISSFDSVKLNSGRPLIICDIDETLLYWDDDSYRNNQLSRFPLFYNKNMMRNRSMSLSSFQNRTILPTDLAGFYRLEQRVRSLGGKIVFLTARHPATASYAIADFLKIGIDASKYEIYYTGNEISKGHFMEKYIDLSGYDDYYFIDDLQENLVSMFKSCHKMNLYLFRRLT